MVDNEKDRKEQMETIRILLLSVQELMKALSPLARDQKDIFKILKSHEEAITRLKDKLMEDEDRGSVDGK